MSDFVDDEAHYRDDCPSLPADRPIGFPHIIDLDHYELDDPGYFSPTCADGVATFLYNWNREQFRRFFDLTEESFELRYDAPEGCVNKMCITRKKNVVTVCNFSQGYYEGVYDQRDPEVTFVIRNSGRWEPQSFRTTWGEGTNSEHVEELGNLITTSMLDEKMWQFTSSTTTITVTYWGSTGQEAYVTHQRASASDDH
ncbi:uncharacterized protein RCC_04983 [Ramularia collo-cygni]|uniref:Uncharacterized protein n=1 Tax=Ramularia collo-cygni TaxID=112498 RepID=A0A2D3V376_9PEZI|nr:uncharacterized protein RCC_04983 [Ramularia collo-cygni]CZT19137.1 uncharacterized protein RCC_04983 [Ramularia collo-cygni]